MTADLVLEAVARREGLEATPEEIDAEVTGLAAVAGQRPEGGPPSARPERTGHVAWPVISSGQGPRPPGRRADVATERLLGVPRQDAPTRPRPRKPSGRGRRTMTERQRLPGSDGDRADQPRGAVVRHLFAAAEGPHHLPGHARSTTRWRTSSSPSSSTSRARIRTRTSTSTSTRPAGRCTRGWRSTTRCSSSARTSPPSAWGWRCRWRRSCWPAGPRARGTRCRTRRS